MNPVIKWQRLPAITLVYFAFKSIPQLLNLWPALLGIWAAGDTARSLLWEHGLLALLAIILLASLLPYWFFRYQIAEDHIQLRSGVLRRKRLTLYFDRVQQADISQPFYFRPFGLATLGLESAGSSQQEVDIPGLPLAEAEEFKGRVLSYRQQRMYPQAAIKEEPAAEQPSPDYELRLPWHEVARYGLMRNSLVFLLPLFAPVLEYQLPAFERWLASLETSHFHQTLLTLANNNQTAIFVFLSVVTAVGSLVAVYTTSALIALIRWWNYHLTRVNDQYQYRAGFFTVRTRGFRLHKLQLVTVSQGVMARLLKRCTVTISKAGGSTPQAQDDQRFLIPTVSPTTFDVLKHQLALPNPRWQRVNGFYIFWNSLITGSVLAFLAAGFLLLNDLSAWPALLTYPIIALITWRRWQCMGFYQDDEWLAFKSGFIGRKTRWLPIVKTQKIAQVQPPWLRPFGLCNFHVWSADGILSAPCMATSTATELQGKILRLVAAFRGKWI